MFPELAINRMLQNDRPLVKVAHIFVQQLFQNSAYMHLSFSSFEYDRSIRYFLV